MPFICYANVLCLLGAMRVLKGHRTFAKGLGEIEFNGFKKESYQKIK
jgi:hypothetical protein